MTRFVPVSDYRSTLETIGGGADITIPSRRRPFTVAVMLLWLCGWAFGEVFAIRTLLSPNPHGDAGAQGFLGFWLIAWTCAGAFVMLTCLWTLFGQERVRFSGSEVSLRREIFGTGFTAHYDPARVTNLRVVEGLALSSPFGMRDPFGWYGGTLAFDYGAHTIRFGAGIETAEAAHLVDKILAVSPSLRRLTNSAP